MKPLSQLDIRHFKQQIEDDEKGLEAKKAELAKTQRAIRDLDIQIKKSSIDLQRRRVEERRLEVEVSMLRSQQLRKRRELAQLMRKLRDSSRLQGPTF